MPTVTTLRRLHPTQYAPAVAAAREVFGEANPYSVFGVAIRPKLACGIPQGYSTLTVFLPRKELNPALPVPSVTFTHRKRTYAVVPDVVATGGPAVAAGCGVGQFSGLHAGAALRVKGGRSCNGGVACLLGSGDSPTHLLTAGHLFPPGAAGMLVEAADDAGSSVEPIGRLEINLLDRSQDTADVALVRLTADGVRMAKRTGADPRLPRLGRRPFNTTSVESTWLKTFLPLTGDYVAGLSGDIAPNTYRVQTDCRSSYAVNNVIASDFSQNTEGNSGTVLMTDDRAGSAKGQAVGVSIGFAGGVSLHEPIDGAMTRIATISGTQLEIWSRA